MALAAGDYLQVSLIGQALSEPMNNVFHIRVAPASSPVGYGTIISWANTLINILKPITNINASWSNIRIYNMSNDLDFIDQELVGAQGTGGGECMPSFTAWGFKMLRSTLATDPGSKRFGGVPEALVTNGIPGAGVATLLNAVSAYIGSEQTVDGGVGDGTSIVQPMIYGAALPARTTKKGTPLPPRPEVFNPVSGAQFVRVTTQNTRKKK